MVCHALESEHGEGSMVLVRALPVYSLANGMPDWIGKPHNRMLSGGFLDRAFRDFLDFFEN